MARVSARQGRMPNARSREAPAVIIIVISNPPVRARCCFVGRKRGSRGKNAGKRPAGGRERGTGERIKRGRGGREGKAHTQSVCPPGYQEQQDARSQTYEEAIVREHFAPVTGARQWPPLTRPVTVSLFADNA